jgi:recombination protein RecT
MVNNTKALAECESMSIVSAAIIAASLDLSLDPNLGYSAIVPFNDKQADGKYLKKAQFQIMYKGLIQLALRSGQYKKLGCTEIYEGQIISENPLTGDYEFDFSVKGKAVVGYAAYFLLNTGFEKTEYWPIEKVKNHGLRFSQTFKKGFGLWKDDFDSMAKKTVLKSLISKWGALSIEVQNAVKFDQSVVKSDNSYQTFEPDYIDNENIEEIREMEELAPGHEKWNDAIKGLKSGAVTVDMLKLKFNISESNEKLLQHGN